MRTVAQSAHRVWHKPPICSQNHRRGCAACHLLITHSAAPLCYNDRILTTFGSSPGAGAVHLAAGTRLAQTLVEEYTSEEWLCQSGAISAISGQRCASWMSTQFVKRLSDRS